VNQYIRFKNRIIEPYICKNILCASAKLVQSMSYFIQCIRSTIIKKVPYLHIVVCIVHMKSSDAKASKCYWKRSSKMIIFIKLIYSSSVISLK